MAECTLSKRLENHLAALGALTQDDVEATFMLYDDYARSNSNCADAQNYITLANALHRVGSMGLSEYAARRSLLASARTWLSYSSLAKLYDKLGQGDVASFFRNVERITKGTPPPATRRAVEYWQDVDCDADPTALCADELKRSASAMAQHQKRYLLQFLYARFYNLNAEGSQYLNDWLARPEFQSLWREDPTAVMEILDFFISRRRLRVTEDDERPNTLLVLRELLALSALARQQKWPLARHDRPAEVMQNYLQPNGRAWKGVGEGIAIYFNFLLKTPAAPPPDAALHTIVAPHSDSRRLADQVAMMAKSLIRTGGKK